MPKRAYEGPDGGCLEGSMLVAMPSMTDPRFYQSVIYVCAHSDEGAMGLIVNKRADGIAFADLLRQLEIKPGRAMSRLSVHFGGPVEMGRGFVLHTDDFDVEGASKPMQDGLALTATVEILRALAVGKGPREAFVALGYAGWAPGQLEAEIQQNGWLSCPATRHLVFGLDDDGKWEEALADIGVDPALLSATGGSA